jgi:hypothetical protein
MAVRPILGVISSIFLIALVAGPASGATPAVGGAAVDTECTGDLVGVTVRNLSVPSGATCAVRDSVVTGTVSASAGSYFQSIRTRVAGDVSGTEAQTLFLDAGSKVQGSVRASRVAQFFLFSSRVRKNVRVDRATDQVFICATTVERGSIQVTRSARNIVIGDPRSGGCGGNSVRRGSMSIRQNTTDVQLVISGNRFPMGNLDVSGNTGPSRKIVQGNSGGRRIACKANAGSFRAVKNRRWKRGACGRK